MDEVTPVWRLYLHGLSKINPFDKSRRVNIQLKLLPPANTVHLLAYLQ